MEFFLVKVQWMPFYHGEEEVRDLWGRHDGPPGERYNFDQKADGNFYGYLRPAAAGNNLNIQKYFRMIEDGFAKQVTVVFVAPEPFAQPQSLKVVGFYLNADVYAGAITAPQMAPNATNIRMISGKAFLVPEHMRDFEVELGDKWGSGTYRGVTKKAAKALAGYIGSFQATDEAQEQVNDRTVSNDKVREWVVISMAERRERRSSQSLRDLKLTAASSYVCACCPLALTEDDHPLKRRMFEVHHTNPVSLLAVGDVREVNPDELAVVCANCHRAIHAPEETRYVSDLKAFKRDVLGHG